MPRSRQELEADLDLIERADALVWEIKRRSPPPEFSYPKPYPGQGESEAKIVEWTRKSERWRKRRLNSRAKAVAELLAQIADLRSSLAWLAHRHLDFPMATEWYCPLRSAAPIQGSALAGICRWGCNSCCAAALQELRQMRQSIKFELANAPAGVRAGALVPGDPSTRRPDGWFSTSTGGIVACMGGVEREVPPGQRSRLFRLVARAGGRSVPWREILQLFIQEDAALGHSACVTKEDTLRRNGQRIRADLGTLKGLWEQDSQGAWWLGGPEQPGVSA
jgi:hypothetical protein